MASVNKILNILAIKGIFLTVYFLIIAKYLILLVRALFFNYKSFVMCNYDISPAVSTTQEILMAAPWRKRKDPEDLLLPLVKSSFRSRRIYDAGIESGGLLDSRQERSSGRISSHFRK